MGAQSTAQQTKHEYQITNIKTQRKYNQRSKQVCAHRTYPLTARTRTRFKNSKNELKWKILAGVLGVGFLLVLVMLVSSVRMCNNL
jgi:hypothetical protein